MKKTCGALAVSLITAMITTNAYAASTQKAKEESYCASLAAGIKDNMGRPTKTKLTEDDCGLILASNSITIEAFFKAGREIGYKAGREIGYKAGFRDGQPTTPTKPIWQTESKQSCPTANTCGQVESELRECKQQLQDARRMGIGEGQMMPNNPYHR